jgi:hypothetical protein
MDSRSFSGIVAASWVLAAAACSMQANCAAQSTGLPREVLLLARIRQNVRSELAHLPDYTCLATIERSTRRSASRPYQRVDTVRVEVAHLGDKELFSEPGANRFEEQLPGEIAGSGLATTGEFALHLRSVFWGSTAITWHGEEDLDGRRALRYDFGVPSFFSSWTIRVDGVSGEVGARGSFWADAQSLELLRLEVHAERLPPNLPVREAVNRIDYGKVRIGSSDVLLPQTAQLVLTDLTGEQHQNTVEFSHCRQYLAESVITFSEPAAETSTSVRRNTEIPIPAGLGLRVQLETEIDLAKAKVGDLITGRVSAVTGKRGLQVVPKGAVLKGRIRWLQRGSRPLERVLVELEFSELEFGGKRGQFFGQLRSVDRLPGLERLASPSTIQMSVNAARALLGIATFRMTGGHWKLPEGFGMQWQTEDPRRRLF